MSKKVSETAPEAPLQTGRTRRGPAATNWDIERVLPMLGNSRRFMASFTRFGETGWNPPQALLSIENDELFVQIDLLEVSDLGDLAEILCCSQIIVHGAKPFLRALKEQFSIVPRDVVCTDVLQRVLRNGTAVPENLEETLYKYFRIKPPRLDPERPRYRRELERFKTSNLGRLRDYLWERIVEEDLRKVAELELSLIPVVVDMEVQGVPVSRKRLAKHLEEARKEHDAAMNTVEGSFGVRFNINNEKQTKAAFVANGLAVDSIKLSGSSRIFVGGQVWQGDECQKI